MAGRISDELLGSKMFLYGAGRIDEEIERPYVGICSTWTEHFPGHNHLDKIAKAVSDGVYMAGGTPCIFGTIAIADCTIGSGKMPNALAPQPRPHLRLYRAHGLRQQVRRPCNSFPAATR